jgi:hypothetical protein
MKALQSSFVALLGGLAACQPAAFPRSAEVAASGDFSAEVSLVPVVYEPQKVRLNNGRSLESKTAFFPMIHGGVRGGLGRCEIGGFYAMTRLAAEGRCALLRPEPGRPLALAFSGALGLDYGPTTAPVGRLGLDASADLGPIWPILGLYFSASRQVRYLEDPKVVPIEGPVPGSQSISRPEHRLTLPLGLAIPVARVAPRYGYSQDTPVRRFSLVLGASPWWSLSSGGCSPSCEKIASWDAEHGIVFSLGLDVR